MRRIKAIFRRLLWDLQYVFLNSFVSYFPSWYVRRFFYFLFGMKLGRGCRIGIGTKVVTPKGIQIGERTIINEGCYLDGRDKIVIGNDSSISFGTVIITGSHAMNSEDFHYVGRTVVIEDHVWIGTHAIILDGSHIHSKAVIGAGSVFKGEAEESGVYVGNPPKLIKKRISECDYKINYHPFFR